MMENKYYTVKVEFQLVDDNGKVKKQKYTYLVDATSVTEAEARVTKKLIDDGENNFEIKAAICSSIQDVIL